MSAKETSDPSFLLQSIHGGVYLDSRPMSASVPGDSNDLRSDGILVSSYPAILLRLWLQRCHSLTLNDPGHTNYATVVKGYIMNTNLFFFHFSSSFVALLPPPKWAAKGRDLHERHQMHDTSRHLIGLRLPSIAIGNLAIRC